MRPQSSMGLGEKCLQARKIRIKLGCKGLASTLFEKATGARIRGRFRQDPTTVVTANGEVQTNEEAQVYVHDLDLFVTVQILDDTLAVLSLSKLCEEHGCSYEWASGQKPHLAPVRLLHRCSRIHQEHLLVQQESKKKEMDNHEAVGNRLRDLPAWLREFTKSRRYRSACNRTHFSWLRFGTSLRKWHQRSTIFLFTFRKTEIAKSSCEPKMTRAPCRKGTVDQVRWAEKLVT